MVRCAGLPFVKGGKEKEYEEKDGERRKARLAPPDHVENEGGEEDKRQPHARERPTEEVEPKYRPNGGDAEYEQLQDQPDTNKNGRNKMEKTERVVRAVPLEHPIERKRVRQRECEQNEPRQRPLREMRQCGNENARDHYDHRKGDHENGFREVL